MSRIQQLDRLEHDLHIGCISHCDNQELLDLLKRTQALLISNKYVLGGHIELPGTDPFMGEHRVVLQALLDGRPARAAACASPPSRPVGHEDRAPAGDPAIVRTAAAAALYYVRACD